MKWQWVTLLAACLAVALYFSGLGATSREKAEREMSAALPPGTDESSVRAYFDGRGIRVDRDDEGTFVGRIRNINRGLLVQKDLMLVVEVDKAGKVTRTSVREYLTGL